MLNTSVFIGRKIISKIKIIRILGLTLAISVLAALTARADDIVGQASVIDGDTIEIRSTHQALGDRRTREHPALPK